jgi:hypothetical protein
LSRIGAMRACLVIGIHRGDGKRPPPPATGYPSPVCTTDSPSEAQARGLTHVAHMRTLLRTPQAGLDHGRWASRKRMNELRGIRRQLPSRAHAARYRARRPRWSLGNMPEPTTPTPDDVLVGPSTGHSGDNPSYQRRRRNRTNAPRRCCSIKPPICASSVSARDGAPARWKCGDSCLAT